MKLQGPDGLPVALRLGQAVVIFFPEECNFKSLSIKNSVRILNKDFVWIDDCLKNGQSPSSSGGDYKKIRPLSNKPSTDLNDLHEGLQSTWRAL